VRIYGVAFLFFLLTCSLCKADTVAWDFPASGYWDTAANWSTDKLPGRGDDVIVSDGYGTVTLNANSNIKSLDIGGAQSLVLSTGRITLNNYAQISSDSTIDVHMHANVNSGSSNAQDLMDLMTANNFSMFTSMEPPQVKYISADTTSQADKDFFSAFPESFLFMYGGTELQPFLVASGRRDSTDFTMGTLYPNGGAGITQSDVDQLNAIASNPSAWETTFKTRAVSAASSGLYVGFGELAPLHSSLKSGQPQMDFKVDTPWMLWLADLAASYNMVLDVHMEANDTTLSEFATLLAHNTSAKIIWDHAGWCNTGLATVSGISRLMATYPDLYISLKMRVNNTACSLTDTNGKLTSDWQTLLETYADRIMVGTDAKYWFDTSTLSDQLSGSYSLLDNVLNQLPPDTAQKIRNGTARALFGI
jgi:hypothetical protein